MPSQEIDDFTALTTPAAGDLLPIVDVSDTTDSPQGTTKKIAVSDLVSGGVVPDDSVTNAKLANMAQATIKGRAAGAGTGDPTDLTGTQATAILDNVVGDSGSGGTKGLVPAPGAGDAAAGKFLKADGTFAVPAGTGAETGANSDITSMDGLTGALENPTQVIFPEAAAPSTPGAGKVTLYAKADGLLYSKDDAGLETVVTGGGGGGGVPASSTNIIPYSDGSAFQNSPVSREDANTLGHWNGTGETATRHNWYTNRADASNYDRLSVRYDTSNDNWVIDSDKAGTGSLRRLHFAVAGTSYWRIETTGHFRAHDSSSQMSLNTGSASAPGLQFGGSSGSNTGIYGPAVNTIGITISSGYTIRFFDLGIQVGHQKGYYISSTALGSGTTTTIGFERENTNIARIVTTESNTGGATYGDLKLRALIGEPVTPSQLTADQNNYNPGRQRFQRWSSDASRTVTGLSNSQGDGQEHLIVNVGSNNIVLSHQNASSSTGNRFLNSTGADITLAANEAADIIYDNTTGRWRVFKR